MPRVCFFNIAAGFGGSERSLLEIIRGLKGTRYEPMLVTPVAGPLTERVEKLGVPVFVKPVGGLLTLGRYASAGDYLRAARGAFLVGYYRWWARLLADEKIDVVHTNSVKCTFLTAPMRLMTNRPRIVWHIRDVMRGKRRFFPLVDALGRWAPDAIVANSDYTAAQFSRCRSRVTRVYNGLVLDDYRPATADEKAEFKRRWNIPADRRLVGILGVITPLKGHRVFLDAAQDILEQREAHFVVVGDEIYDTAGHRGYRASLEAYAQELGIADRVTFTGFIGDVERALGCLDVLVQASVEPESFGRVVVEAQASGVPVVASRIGAIPEIIRDGSLGTLVPPGDSDAIARAVRRYLDFDELYRRTAAAARRHALECFSVTRVIGELSALYDRLLREKTHRA